MITRVVIDGRAGSACYVDSNFVPVDEAKATLLKVVFDDGGQLILGVPPSSDDRVVQAKKELAQAREESEERRQRAWHEAKMRAKATLAPRAPPPDPAEGERRRKWLAAKAQAQALLARGDFIQDPETGKMEGSHPGGGSEDSGGIAPVSGKKPGGGKGSAKVEARSDFRKDKIGLSIVGVTEKEFMEIWNDKIGMDPGEFKKDFLGGANGSMRLFFRTFTHDKSQRLEIHGKVREGGKVVGEFERHIDLSKKTAESAFFKINPKAQGSGIGKQLLAGNVAMYRELGIKHVDTHANIDVGGYAWAKYGYVPDKKSWAILQKNFRDRVVPSKLSDDHKKQLLDVINQSNPRLMWNIADSLYGKQLLLGTNWTGRLDLDDAASMARFNAYVGKKSTPKKMFAAAKHRAGQIEPTKGSKNPKSKEFFYEDDDGTIGDDWIHEEILDEGDDEAAKKISDAEQIINPKVVKGDYIQDPTTGKLQGSHPGGGKDEGGDGSGAGPKAVDYKPGIKTSNVAGKGFKQVKEGWYEKSPFKPDDIEGAMAAASVAQKDLGNFGGAIGKKLGVKFVNPGPKTNVARIKQKAADKDGVHRVSDLARAAFIVTTPEQADEIAAELAKHFEVASEDWKVTPVLYADKSLQLRFKNGTIGEIQILDSAMNQAKQAGHKLYEEQRQLDPVKDKERWDALSTQMQEIYGSVLRGYTPSWRHALRRP